MLLAAMNENRLSRFSVTLKRCKLENETRTPPDKLTESRSALLKATPIAFGPNVSLAMYVE
jgi:hypothetical protein